MLGIKDFSGFGESTILKDIPLFLMQAMSCTTRDERDDGLAS